MQRTRCCIAALTVATHILVGSHTYSQSPLVECNCHLTGSYNPPSSKAILVEGGDNYQEGSSPNGIYTLTAEDGFNPGDSHIEIKRGNQTILSVTSSATGWGFSPNDHAFVMHGFTNGGQHLIWLYDLNPDPTVSGEDAVEVLSTIPTTLSSASLRFSPHGKYLLYAGLGNERTLMLHIYDTKTGDAVYSETGGAPISGQPSGESVAGWGFSSDALDRSFVHAYQHDAHSYGLAAVNLETGQEIVHSSFQSGIATFRFSPCGDYFLWTSQEGTNDQLCNFYKTSEANDSPDHQFTGEYLEYIKTTETEHQLKFEGDQTVYTFPNTASGDCGDDSPPTWLPGASFTVTEATGTTLDLLWDEATDSKGVINYRITSGGDLLMELSDANHCTLDGLQPSTTYPLELRAGDQAGNWTPDPLTTSGTTEEDNEPTWGPDKSLIASDIESMKLTLTWEGASDDHGITSFRIYRNGDLKEEVEGDRSTALITGLVPQDVDTFRVEACDAAGHETTDGPALITTTEADNPPEWPAGASLYEDEITETTIAFHWDAATDDYGVTRYKILRNGEETAIVHHQTTQFTDTDLDAGTTYTYEVQAGDGTGTHWSIPLEKTITTMPEYMAMPLVTASNEQWAPDIDGQLVVWQDKRNGSDIYQYKLTTNTEKILASTAEAQSQARACDGRVVWVDYRNGNADIYMKDLKHPIPTDIVICDADSSQLTPAIHGNIITWTDNRNGNWDIYMYDLLTGEESAVCTNNNTQINPDVAGNIIVWEDHRHGNPDIYGYNIALDEVFEVCRHSGEQRKPSIENPPGHRIVWQDNRSGEWNIWHRYVTYNGFKNGKVYLDPYGNQTCPHIADGILVYQDDQSGNQDIYAYEYTSQYLGEIIPVCTEPGDQLIPRTSGGRIVWEDHRNDQGDIYIWDRPPGTDLAVEVSENNDPIGAGKTLVYRIDVSNDGPDNEDQAELTCRLPVMAILEEHLQSAGSVEVTGLDLTWTIGSLRADSSETLRLQMKTFDIGPLILQTEITGSGFDPEPSNNHHREKTSVQYVAGENVDSGESPSLAVTPAGTVHMAYGTEDSVFYARKYMNSDWLIESPDSVQRYVSGDILRDRDGKIHICYSDLNWNQSPLSRMFSLTRDTDDQWTNRIIALSDSGFWSISQAESPSGTRHVTYQKADGPAFTAPVRYKNNRPGYWSHPKTLYEHAYDRVAMEMDSTGHAHVATIGINEGPLYQTSMDSLINDWSVPAPVEPDWQGGQLEAMVTDLDLDSLLRPHIIYPGGTDGDQKENIKYAFKESGQWQITEIDNGDFGSAANALAVEPSGVVHAVYTHFPSNQVRYATNVAGPWIRQVLEPEGEVWTGNLDVEMDRSRNVHIGYALGNEIKYALRPPIRYCTVDPDTLLFGPVEQGGSKTLTLRLANPGREPIYLDSLRFGEASPFFTTDFVPVTLYRDDTISIDITFTPTETLSVSRPVHIWFRGKSILCMDLPMIAATPSPSLTVRPEMMQFVDVPQGEEEIRSFTLINSGTKDLEISSLELAYYMFGYPYPTDFELKGHDCSLLVPGDSCHVEIGFTPVKLSPQQSNLYIHSNDPLEPSKKVSVTGTALNPAALMLADPTELNFGYVEQGSEKVESVTLTNEGAAELTITGVGLDGPCASQFVVDDYPVTLVPGASGELIVRYVPTTQAACQTTLNIASNSMYNTLSINLKGSSSLIELTPSPDSILFDNVLPGDSAMAVLTLSNTGDENLSLYTLQIIGADMYEFRRRGAENTVEPGASTQDTIWFKPQFEGDKRSDLVITSNDVEQAEQHIPLRGISLEEVMALDALAGATPLSGEAPLEVTMSLEVSGGQPPFSFSWEYGGTVFSTEREPVYQFADPGVYNVKVTVTDFSGTAVSDLLTIEVTEPLFEMGGTVYHAGGANPVEAGAISLMAKDSADPLDEMNLENNGIYLFNNLPAGTYTLKAEADTAGYPEALPTYLGDVIMLNDATWLNLQEDHTGQDIHVQEDPGEGSGDGKISGTLTGESGSKKVTVQTGGVDAVTGDGLENVYVYLMDHEAGILAAADITAVDGSFRFNRLMESGYEFMVDYKGLPMDEDNPVLELTAEVDSIHIAATVSDTEISAVIMETGIASRSLPEGVSIYPNPARTHLHIFDYRGQAAKNIRRIEWINATGIPLFELSFPDGLREAVIPVGHLASGIYFLNLCHDEGCYRVRIMIID